MSNAWVSTQYGSTTSAVRAAYQSNVIDVGSAGSRQVVATATHRADRHATSHRWIGARPGVADAEHTGGDRCTVHHEAPPTVLDAAEGDDVAALVGRSPMTCRRVGVDHSLPHVDVGGAAHRPVGGAGHEHDAPPTLVGRKGGDVVRAVELAERRDERWQGAVAVVEVASSTRSRRRRSPRPVVDSRRRRAGHRAANGGRRTSTTTSAVISPSVEVRTPRT